LQIRRDRLGGPMNGMNLFFTALAAVILVLLILFLAGQIT
jgi:uncharacterized membrane protein